MLKALGFDSFNSDLCLFKNSRTGALILIYVDDFLMAAPELGEIYRTAKIINSHYSLKEIGEAKKFLGFEIIRNRSERKIQLSQRSYAEKTLVKYGYEKANPV